MTPPTLVIGGARSGKSGHAQAWAEQTPSPVLVATCRRMPDDTGMAARIEAHRKARRPDWTVIEEDLAPGQVLRRLARPDGDGPRIVVDCLGMWLTNLLLDGLDPVPATQELCAALTTIPLPVMLVTSEVGQGVIPASALGRQFRDAAGRMNAQVAAAVPSVVWMVAGIAVPIKPQALPE